MLGDDDLIEFETRNENRGVYVVTCRTTGSRYVGSSGDVAARWSKHRSGLRKGRNKNPTLQAEWDCYGESDFDFALQEYVKDPADLQAREQHWIDRLGTANRLSAKVGRPGRTYLQSPEVRDRAERKLFDESILQEWATLEVAEEFRAARRFKPNHYASDEERHQFAVDFRRAVDAKKAEIAERLAA